MPVRLGLLSTARINDEILQGATPSADVDVVAVGSRDRARAEAYSLERGIPRAHGSYEELLADPDVDAIYNSLPNSLHVPWTLRALDAGKHVLVEKPFDRRPAEVARAFDAADAAGLIVMEAFMYRHHPQTKRLRELVARGSIGELREIRSTFTYQLDDPTDVRLYRELDGGSLMDLGCYCVSGSRLLAGEPELVEGTQLIGGDGVDVHFTGTLKFPGGVESRFECGFDSPPSSTLEAIGSEGSAHVREPWSCSEHAIELRRNCQTARVEVEDADRYRLQLENFAAAIEGKAEPLLGRADALGQVRTIEALYQSAEAGAAVAVVG
ncbi:MAG TPA: Gfo/Idh/MocA family oxidoreductase [Gaiellaceae bacterium]|jgi:predicted dehydrogenase